MEIPKILNATGFSNATKIVTEYLTPSFLRTERPLLQIIWDLRLGYEPYLASPLFPVFLSVIFYFALCLPFMLFDIFCKKQVWYRKYKIQIDKEVTKEHIYDTLNLTFWNHVLFVMPGAVAQWIWTPVTPLPDEAPSMFEFCWHQLAALVVFDLQYYVWHMSHHKIRFLYKHIHAVHHRYSSPFVWVTQYLHPWELVTVGFLTTTNTWFFNSHPLTVWSYMLVSIIVSVEAHIGFDFPFLLHNLDPTGNIGGSPKHDMHHQKPLTNYQPFFNHWDKMFGSYCPPMSGGGIKSQALLDYEKRAKQCKKNI
ncbi:cholesterol 25-hydroxylase-like protein 1, member 2 [Biomphalaria glabrata]|uniref:Cholesterol 25-hydroxylase-like protein 1, member 2 n=1 Tax=Biomphalaria glabrata TaxID=6526 RepID=A0A9W2ZH66_BIOGL|nr:cholesterol 25-hydroxylase-like protein 1, member 2 [Biomphalaria glabrata]